MPPAALQFSPSFSQLRAGGSGDGGTDFQFFGMRRCAGGWLDTSGVPNMNVSQPARSLWMVNVGELGGSPYFATAAADLVADAALGPPPVPVVLFFSLPTLIFDLGVAHQVTGFKVRCDAQTSPRAPRTLRLWYATSLTLAGDGTASAASNDGNWQLAGTYTTTKVDGWSAFGALAQLPGAVTSAATGGEGGVGTSHSNLTMTFTVDLRNEGEQVCKGCWMA